MGNAKGVPSFCLTSTRLQQQDSLISSLEASIAGTGGRGSITHLDEAGSTAICHETGCEFLAVKQALEWPINFGLRVRLSLYYR